MTKKTPIILLTLLLALPVLGQQRLTLSACRYLATQSNPALRAAEERIAAAEALQRMAFCQFLPKVDANGTYVWNQKSIKPLSDRQAYDINHIGTTVESDIANSLSDFLASLGINDPQLANAIVQNLGGLRLEENLNNIQERKGV